LGDAVFTMPRSACGLGAAPTVTLADAFRVPDALLLQAVLSYPTTDHLKLPEAGAVAVTWTVTVSPPAMAGPALDGATSLNWLAPGPVLPVHPEAATGLAERLMDVKLPNPGAVNTRHRGFWFASGVEVFDPSFDRNVSVNAVGVVAVVDVGLIVKFCSLMSAKAGPANTATRTAAVVARTAALKNLLLRITPPLYRRPLWPDLSVPVASPGLQ